MKLTRFKKRGLTKGILALPVIAVIVLAGIFGYAAFATGLTSQSSTSNNTTTTSSSATTQAQGSGATVQIQVSTVSSNGTQYGGLLTYLMQGNSNTNYQSCYSPCTMTAQAGQTYRLAVDNYGQFTFMKWSDLSTGMTSWGGVRWITTPSTSTTLQYTAIYSQDMDLPWNGGFLNGQVVTLVYTHDYTCNPGVTSFGFNSTEAHNAQALTSCEVGGFKGNPSLPNLYILVPAFSGLSIFGVPKLGASSQGFPMFQNQTIITDCGAGGTHAACGDHPTYMYSPAFTVVEHYLGIDSGVFGLPEGVLPTPAHSHLLNESDTGGWNNVAVLVFDPNIFPNPETGQCTQMVPSSSANPTANCLNTYSALQAALTTNSSNAVLAANQQNPIFNALGAPKTQVVVPGDMNVPELANPNMNLVLYFNVYNYNPYPPFTNFGDLTSSAATPMP